MMSTDIEVRDGAMSTQMRSLLASGFGEVRYEPTAKRIRASLGGATVVDSARAMLVWEPRRVVPSYAVPVDDVRGELVPVGAAAAEVTEDIGSRLPDVSSRPVLDPSIPFAVHTAEGQVVDLLAGGQSRPGAGFRVADAELAGYVVLDFHALDSWYEEDEPNVAHPRDPFHRIDVLPALVTSAWSWTVRSWPRAPGRHCCSRRCCLPATTCHARTSGPSWSLVAPNLRRL
jgi:hypothetical protein